MSVDDEAREAQVAVIMAGGQPAINKFLILGIMNLQNNGCARACTEQAEKNKSLNPHLTTSALAVSIVSAIEAVKYYFQSKAGG